MIPDAVSASRRGRTSVDIAAADLRDRCAVVENTVTSCGNQVAACDCFDHAAVVVQDHCGIVIHSLGGFRRDAPHGQRSQVPDGRHIILQAAIVFNRINGDLATPSRILNCQGAVIHDWGACTVGAAWCRSAGLVDHGAAFQVQRQGAIIDQGAPDLLTVQVEGDIGDEGVGSGLALVLEGAAVGEHLHGGAAGLGQGRDGLFQGGIVLVRPVPGHFDFIAGVDTVNIHRAALGFAAGDRADKYLSAIGGILQEPGDTVVVVIVDAHGFIRGAGQFLAEFQKRVGGLDHIIGLAADVHGVGDRFSGVGAVVAVLLFVQDEVGLVAVDSSGDFDFQHRGAAVRGNGGVDAGQRQGLAVRIPCAGGRTAGNFRCDGAVQTGQLHGGGVGGDQFLIDDHIRVVLHNELNFEPVPLLRGPTVIEVGPGDIVLNLDAAGFHIASVAIPQPCGGDGNAVIGLRSITLTLIDRSPLQISRTFKNDFAGSETAVNICSVLLVRVRLVIEQFHRCKQRTSNLQRTVDINFRIRHIVYICLPDITLCWGIRNCHSIVWIGVTLSDIGFIIIGKQRRRTLERCSLRYDKLCTRHQRQVLYARYGCCSALNVNGKVSHQWHNIRLCVQRDIHAKGFQ